jgi:hypothetical protein
VPKADILDFRFQGLVVAADEVIGVSLTRYVGLS